MGMECNVRHARTDSHVLLRAAAHRRVELDEIVQRVLFKRIEARTDVCALHHVVPEHLRQRVSARCCKALRHVANMPRAATHRRHVCSGATKWLEIRRSSVSAAQRSDTRRTAARSVAAYVGMDSNRDASKPKA